MNTETKHTLIEVRRYTGTRGGGKSSVMATDHRAIIGCLPSTVSMAIGGENGKLVRICMTYDAARKIGEQILAACDRHQSLINARRSA